MNILKSLLILIIFIFSACGKKDKSTHEKFSDSKNEISRAERLTLEKKRGYTILTINNPWQGAKNLSQTYYIIKKGCEIPSELDSTAVIFVPLKKISFIRKN